MKKQLHYFSILALSATLLLTSCGTTKEVAAAAEGEPVEAEKPQEEENKEETKEAETIEKTEEATANTENKGVKKDIDYSTGTFSADGGPKKTNDGGSSTVGDQKELVPTGKVEDTQKPVNKAAEKGFKIEQHMKELPEDEQIKEDEIKLFSTEWSEESYNDPLKCGYFYTTDNLGEFKMIQGDFRKLGGYEKSTVGFVFGFSKPNKGMLSNYIRFEINPAGEFGVYSWAETTENGKKKMIYTDLVEKQAQDVAYLYPTDAVKKGYNKQNTLKIQKGKDNTYTLFINGTKVAEKIPPLKNGTDGVMAFFSVGKSDQEKFPDNPVTVTYRISDSEIK